MSIHTFETVLAVKQTLKDARVFNVVAMSDQGLDILAHVACRACEMAEVYRSPRSFRVCTRWDEPSRSTLTELHNPEAQL